MKKIMLILFFGFIGFTCLVSSVVSLRAKQYSASICGNYETVRLCDTSSSTKTYENGSINWSQGSRQYAFWNCGKDGIRKGHAGKNEYGDLRIDDLGFYYVEADGIKYYTVAMASYFTSMIGEKFRITLENDKTFYVIIGDQKADKDTHAGNVPGTGNHCLAGSQDMIEFIIDEDTAKQKLGSDNGLAANGSFNKDFDDLHRFEGIVTKVERRLSGSYACSSSNGSIEGEPNFSNHDVWQVKNPYKCQGQCTWFAWGRFYEIYGYDPGFRGDGYMCARQLVNAHSDKFELSDTPKAGAVGSSDAANNHVWIVVGVDGDNITIQEGNLAGYNGDILACDPWNFAITDWHTITYTLEQLKSLYGDVVFANPK